MVFHKEHRVPYIYKGYEWIGYDDPFSLHLKVRSSYPCYDGPYCLHITRVSACRLWSVGITRTSDIRTVSLFHNIAPESPSY